MASTKKIKASIFIPLYNGEEYLEAMFTAIFAQECDFAFEVLATDSGSTDSTIEIVKKFPKVIFDQIPNAEFGHGRTRNRAATKANGEFMVFLSQDAVPAHNKWLEYMLEPFALNENVQGVFGKQIPRVIADMTTRREVSSVFDSLGPDHSIMVNRAGSLISSHSFSPGLGFYSDVNSAVRRDFLLNSKPYRDVKYAEDQLFGKELMDDGLLKAYTPYGTVEHSNEYGLRDFFYRKFDEAMGMHVALGVTPSRNPAKHIGAALKGSAKDTWLSLIDPHYSPKRKAYNVATSWYRNFSGRYAAWLVSQEKYREKNKDKYSLEARRK